MWLSSNSIKLNLQKKIFQTGYLYEILVHNIINNAIVQSHLNSFKPRTSWSFWHE